MGKTTNLNHLKVRCKYSQQQSEIEIINTAEYSTKHDQTDRGGEDRFKKREKKEQLIAKEDKTKHQAPSPEN